LFKLKNQQRKDVEQILKIKPNRALTGHGAPFPQADKLDKIIKLLLLIGDMGDSTKAEIFLCQEIVYRQWDYYLNALKWLGLVKKDPVEQRYTLTDDGSKCFAMTEPERIFFIAERVFSNEIFNAFLTIEKPSFSASVLQRNKLNPESSTLGRRMQTVRAWKKYLFTMLDIY